MFDELEDMFRAFRLVTIPIPDSRLASHEAALDGGATNLVACTVSTGTQYLYEGPTLFEKFRDITELIAHYQPLLEKPSRIQ